MATTYELIASTTLGSAAATISFSSIPATYDDLVIACSLRTTHSAAVDTYIKFNTSTSNYSRRLLYTSNGTSAASYADSNRIVGAIGGTNFTANTFSSMKLYIPNYAGSANKSVSITNVAENNATAAYIEAVAFLWSDTTAIDAIELSPGSGNFAANSSAYLYGITKS